MFLTFALLYGFTCARGLAWQDSGIFQLRIFTGDLRGWLGLALAHPLFIAAAQPVRWLPHAWEPWGVNFVSGFWAAVALANLACLTAKLTNARWAGLAVAGMLGVCHTFWWLASVTETYTMQVALFTAELWLLVRLLDKPSGRRLAALALVSGLGFSLHNLSLLALPVYLVCAGVLLARRRIGWGALGLAAVAWLAGAGLYLALIIQQMMATGDVLGTLRDALVGSYGADVLNMGTKSNPHTLVNRALMAMNLASFLLPLGIVGWWQFRRLGRPLAWSLGAITAMEILFVARYPVADQFMFVLPSLVMIALAAGVGTVALARRSRTWRRLVGLACVLSILLPPVAQYVSANLLTGHPMNAERRPFRKEARYWLVPWKYNENSADEFARSAFLLAGPEGVILTDNTAHPVLVLTAERTPGCRISIHYDHAIDRDRSDLPGCGKTPAAFIEALGHRELWATSRNAVPPALRASVTLDPEERVTKLVHVTINP